MSGVFQEFAQEVTLDVKKEIALQLLEIAKLSYEEIATSTNLSIAEVQALAAQREPA